MTRREHINQIIDKLMLFWRIFMIALIVAAVAATVTFFVLGWTLGAFLMAAGCALSIFVLNFVISNHLLRLKFTNMTDEEYAAYRKNQEEKKKAKM